MTTSTLPPPPENSALSNRILFGLAAGLALGILTVSLGSFFPPLLSSAQFLSRNFLDPFGQIFLRILFFTVLPLVFASLALGVLDLGKLDRIGSLAAKTFFFFFLTMAIAVGIGLTLMETIAPGRLLSAQTKTTLTEEFGAKAKDIPATAASTEISLGQIVDMFLPRNLLGAVAGQNRNAIGDVLPLIVFSILVGAAGASLKEEQQKKLRSALEILADLMTTIVHFALAIAPFAVPALIFGVIVKTGAGIILSLGLFVVVCTTAMAIQLFLVLPAFLLLFSKIPPLLFFKKIRPVLITAFSTSSSNATLPLTLACAREELGIRSSVSGFVISLGATMNMGGTALYEGCVVLFVAQVFGIDLSIAQQISLLLLSVLSAVAVAGIPGGSLPLIAGLLASFGVPPDGIGIILGADRILDMARTTLNVAGDITTAAIVDSLTPAD